MEWIDMNTWNERWTSSFSHFLFLFQMLIKCWKDSSAILQIAFTFDNHIEPAYCNVTLATREKLLLQWLKHEHENEHLQSTYTRMSVYIVQEHLDLCKHQQCLHTSKCSEMNIMYISMYGIEHVHEHEHEHKHEHHGHGHGHGHSPW